MLLVISDPGLYLCIFCSLRLRCGATTKTAGFNKDGRRARPSLPTLPGTDGTIGRQGPGVRTGRLGTLQLMRKVGDQMGEIFLDVLVFCVDKVGLGLDRDSPQDEWAAAL